MQRQRWLIWSCWLCSHAKYADSPPWLVLNSVHINKKKCRRWGRKITSSTSEVIKGLLHPLKQPAEGFTRRTLGRLCPHTHGQLKDQGWGSCLALAPAARASLSSLCCGRGFLSISLSLAPSLPLVRSVPSLICWKIYSEAFSCPPTQTHRLCKCSKTPSSLPGHGSVSSEGERERLWQTERCLCCCFPRQYAVNLGPQRRQTSLQ